MRSGASAQRFSWISNRDKRLIPNFPFSYKTNSFLQQATNNDTGQATVSLHARGRFQSPASNLMLQEYSMSCGHDL